MAAEGKLLQWRWNLGTVGVDLTVIWEISVKSVKTPIAIVSGGEYISKLKKYPRARNLILATGSCPPLPQSGAKKNQQES